MTNNRSLAAFLRKGNIPELLNCNRIKPGHSRHCPFLPHRHNDRLELFYVAEGQILYTVDGITYPLIPGDLVICNQNVVHGDSWVVPGNQAGYLSYSVALTHVSFIGMPDNTLSYGQSSPVLRLEADTRDVTALFKNLHILTHHKGASDLLCQSMALSLLLSVYQQLMRQRERDLVYHGAGPKALPHDICTSMRQYLDRNFTEALTLSAMGRTFHASEYHLAHLFKDRYAISPMQYLLKRRLGEAQTYLIDTECPIAQIAEQVNGGSPSHFSSMFSKHIGLPPSNYRSRFKEMNVY